MCFLSFVWRQLELAFFGALTSVGALFVFLNEKSIAPLLRHNLFGKKKYKSTSIRRPKYRVGKSGAIDSLFLCFIEPPVAMSAIG